MEYFRAVHTEREQEGHSGQEVDIQHDSLLVEHHGWNCREEGYKQGLLISETARGSIKQKGRLTLTFLRFLIFERVKTRWKEPSKYFR